MIWHQYRCVSPRVYASSRNKTIASTIDKVEVVGKQMMEEIEC